MKFHAIKMQGTPRSCVARAITAATGMRFATVYRQLWLLTRFYYTRGMSKKFSPDKGLPRRGVHAYMLALGYKWVPKLKPGSNKRTRISNLPKKGNLIACGYRHMVAVKDGVVYDLTPWTIKRNICVIGYYKKI